MALDWVLELQVTVPLSRYVLWTAVVLGATSVAFVSCASRADALVLDRSRATFDGLYPVASEFFEQAYARDGLDLSSYRKVMTEQSLSNYRHVPRDAAQSERQLIITPPNRARFEQGFVAAVVNNLEASKRFDLASTPANDVLTLWGTLADVNAQGAAGGARVAEFILVLELRDSLTEVTLVRVIHPYEIELEQDDKQASWERLAAVIEEVAANLRTGLDRLIGG